MDDNDGHRWDDDRLMALLTGLLDDPGVDCAEASTSAAPNDQPAKLSLEDVVAAGRAAFYWLDVVVTCRAWPDTSGRPPEPRPPASPATSSAAPHGIDDDLKARVSPLRRAAHCSEWAVRSEAVRPGARRCSTAPAPGPRSPCAGSRWTAGTPRDANA